MTDDTTANFQDEAGTPAVPEPAVDELPTSVSAPATTEEAAQTIAPRLPIDTFSTVTSVPPVETAPAVSVSMAAPTGQAPAQLAQPAPALAYEQFGAPSAATPTAQPVPYPDITTPANAQLRPGESATFSAQSTYASYPGQPGQFYASQPGQPGVSTPATKKRRTLLWVAIVLLAILLFGGSAALTYALTQPQTSAPNAILKTYCQDVENGDAQGIYNLLSQQAKTHTSIDDLQNTFNSLNPSESLGIKISNCTFSNLRVSSSLAVATVSLTLSMTFEGQTTTITSPSLVSLVLESNQWKIDFSTLTQPLPSINVPGNTSGF